MGTDRNPRRRTALVTAIGLLCGLLAMLAVGVFPAPPKWIPELFVFLVRVQVFVTTFNLVLLMALLWTYVSLYRDLPNRYTRSLILLSLALLLYALTANPVIHLAFGFPPSGGSPFIVIPHAFVGVAIIVLFYQSQT
ncbi:hypothetical protein [Haloplanus halobius]|uniref:hypothetical protein n=1 Tax=Haloplanus halobius TaxID=2934938 RepID=UPI0020108B93|nr:hypothetical protein [Haloplanus sp. XH21]